MSPRLAFARAALAFAAFAVLLSGCTARVSAREDAESLSQVEGNQVLVVGKIELIRPLADKEQLLRPKGVELFKNKAFILLSENGYDLNGTPDRSAHDATGAVTLGKTFFLPVNKGKILHYSGGVIVINDWALLGGSNAGGIFGIWNLLRTDHFALPGGLKFNLTPGDRTVYIGTIQYYRDDFNAIAKARIKDEYAQASAEFKSRYKSAGTLRKLSPEK